MDTEASGNTESEQVDVKKVDVEILSINLFLPVVVILVSGGVMIFKSYWAGCGFFAIGIVFWILIFYMHKFFRDK